MARSRPDNSGQIAYIDAKGRLAVPAALARALGWEMLSGATEMVVELTGPGRVHIYRDADVTADLKTMRERLHAESEASDDDEALRAFEDRYRKATLYRDGFRIALAVEVRAFLFDSWKGRIPVFVEVSTNRLIVLSRTTRQQRLADLLDEISLG